MTSISKKALKLKSNFQENVKEKPNNFIYSTGIEAAQYSTQKIHDLCIVLSMYYKVKCESKRNRVRDKD